MSSVAVYARVSTDLQSADMQLRDLRQYCESRGLTILEEYVDTGISGLKERRPALDRLMKDARNKRFDQVLVWRFDRMARSTRHLVAQLEEFETLGIKFTSYQENIDTGTPMGRAMYTIISAMAQLERDVIVERVRAGLKNAKARGVKLGAPISVDRKQVLALRKKKLSVRKIAKEMGIAFSTVHRIIKEHRSA